jgi:hypothetical protein
MSLEALRALERALAKEVPTFEVRFKDESKLMRFLGLIMCPFNPTFLRDFTTTLGPVVYFPSRARYEATPDASIETLAHEFVHIHDSRAAGIRFQLSYAAPQAWAVPPLVLFGLFGGALPLALYLGAYVALAATLGRKKTFWPLLAAAVLVVVGVAVKTAGWWTLLLVGALACLGPWPSPGRTHWELRGYAMNVAIYIWVRNALLPEELLREYVRLFTGSDYWFMCRDREKVEASFAATVRTTLERKLQLEKPYSTIHEFLVEHGRVAPAFSE